MTSALDSTDLTKLGIGVILALIVVGFVLSMLITALVARLVIAAIVIGLGAFVWQQRTSIKDDIDNCKINDSYSYFGITVDIPPSVEQHCRQVQKLRR